LNTAGSFINGGQDVGAIFGTMLHPGEDSPHILAAIDKATSSVQHQESLYRLWKASNTILSLNEWVLEQKSAARAARIKREEKDATLSVGEQSRDSEVMEEFGFKAITSGSKVIYELVD